MEHPELKEVDILKEDYNILNYKYAECIKVNTRLKEVNKLLVDALEGVKRMTDNYRVMGTLEGLDKLCYRINSYTKASLKEANLIK